MILNIFQKFLCTLNPETAHHVFLNTLKFAYKLKILKFFLPKPNQRKTVQLMGLNFQNQLGLAAGLDKNGEYIDALSALGFGFIEIGTVTLKPQSGNPKPRLFRYIQDQAIVNRMGFNSEGVDYVIEQLKNTQYKGILGINIGKNRETKIADAADEYVSLYKKLSPYASYITINISSPNTPDLRELQNPTYLSDLIRKLKQIQNEQKNLLNKYVPLVVKISPDLSLNDLEQMAAIFLTDKVDGIIATNTTIQHSYPEKGGLSGKPLSDISTVMIQRLNGMLQNKIPIIGCGGVMNFADVKTKINAGAQLVQIYSGLVFNTDILHEVFNNIGKH